MIKIEIDRAKHVFLIEGSGDRTEISIDLLNAVEKILEVYGSDSNADAARYGFIATLFDDLRGKEMTKEEREMLCDLYRRPSEDLKQNDSLFGRLRRFK